MIAKIWAIIRITIDRCHPTSKLVITICDSSEVLWEHDALINILDDNRLGQLLSFSLKMFCITYTAGKDH